MQPEIANFSIGCKSLEFN